MSKDLGEGVQGTLDKVQTENEFYKPMACLFIIEVLIQKNCKTLASGETIKECNLGSDTNNEIVNYYTC